MKLPNTFGKRKDKLTGFKSVDFHFRDVHMRKDLNGNCRLGDQFSGVQNINFERSGCGWCVTDGIGTITIIVHLDGYRLILFICDVNVQIT